MKVACQLGLFLVISFLISSCVQAPDAQKAKTEAPKTVEKVIAVTSKVLDLNNSKVIFTGTKPTGRHVGVLPLKSGGLQFKGGKLVGGKFVIDVANLKITDLEGEMATKLEGHLKSGDFFGVENYPEANFEIAKVQALENNEAKITGNLTLIGITQSISFNAKSLDNKTFTASFNIDRTNWGLIYGNDKSLGDKFINPLVNIVLTIVSK